MLNYLYGLWILMGMVEDECVFGGATCEIREYSHFTVYDDIE